MPALPALTGVLLQLSGSARRAPSLSWLQGSPWRPWRRRGPPADRHFDLLSGRTAAQRRSRPTQQLGARSSPSTAYEQQWRRPAALTHGPCAPRCARGPAAAPCAPAAGGCCPCCRRRRRLGPRVLEHSCPVGAPATVAAAGSPVCGVCILAPAAAVDHHVLPGQRQRQPAARPSRCVAVGAATQSGRAGVKRAGHELLHCVIDISYELAPVSFLCHHCPQIRRCTPPT